ncbi:hypothetical protein HG530_007628 [Fusarium avenaceum]|nr:hypothetical protein HG530_007628 [Fusarium avenaceum]
MLDVLAPATTGVASLLELLEHAGGELALHETNTVAAAGLTSIDLAVFTSTALTGFADVLLVPGEFGSGAVVEVAQGDLNTDFDVVTSGFAGSSSEMTVATEETAEEVEGIMAATATSSLAALLHAVVAVLVVDLAHFLIA